MRKRKRKVAGSCPMPPGPFRVWNDRGGWWRLSIHTVQLPTLWKLGANLARDTARGAPHHLIYNPGNNKTDMGGTESLRTIWLQVANFKEKKFLMNDINQLQSCLNQARVLKWSPQVPIRRRDLNKGQNKHIKTNTFGTLGCPNSGLSHRTVRHSTLKTRLPLSLHSWGYLCIQCFTISLL